MYRVAARINGFSQENLEKIYSLIAEIDVVKGSWRLTNTIVPQTIAHLKQSTIITSTGASNRIEGNRLSDNEARDLYKNINVKKFKTRDEQEIAGYIEVLHFIFDSYDEIAISESNILWLHQEMLKYCEKDERRRGNYKTGPNRVEAQDPFGKVVGVVFDPTPPHLVKKEIGDKNPEIRALYASNARKTI
jgi:Fic family protein